jgi:hypothetical protein
MAAIAELLDNAVDEVWYYTMSHVLFFLGWVCGTT